MNRKILELREVVTKLVPMIAGKGLKVTQMGTNAYVKTDLVTKKPILVNIPMIPENAEDSFIEAIQGFIDHEVAHVLITDWNFYGGENLTPKQLEEPGRKAFVNTHNIIEDTMIEREMAKLFPGSKHNIARLRQHFIERITKKALESEADPKRRFIYLIVPVCRALAGHVEFQDFLTEEGHWEAPYVKEFVAAISDDLRKRLQTASTTKETLAITREVHDILYPPPPPMPDPSMAAAISTPPPEDEKGKSQDKPEKQAGEGDGDGERDHQENDPGKEDGESGTKDPGLDEDDDDAGGADSEGDDADEEESSGESDGADEGDDTGEEDAADEASGEDDADDGDEGGAEETDGDGESDDDGDGESDDDADEGDEPASGGGEDEGEDPVRPDHDEGGESDVEDDSASGGDADQDSDDEEDTADGEDEAGGEKGGASEGASDGSGPNDPAADRDLNDESSGETLGGVDEDDDGKGGGGGVGSAESKSMFDFTEDAFDEADMSSAISRELSDRIVEALNNSGEYMPYSLDFDRIEPLQVPANINPSWVPKMNDQIAPMIGPMQKEIERMMASQSFVLRIPGQRKGRLHAPSLYRVPQGDPRVFTKREEHTSKNTAVTLLIDNSGSMSGQKMRLAMLAGYALTSTLEKVKIPNEVIGFTTGGWHDVPNTLYNAMQDEMSEKGVEFDRYLPIIMPIYKEFDERINVTVRERIAYAMNAQVGLSGNIDGESLLYAAYRLAKRPEKRKVMIVLSDGQPAGGRKSGPHLKMVVRDMEKKFGIECIGIGIMDASVKHYYPQSVVLNSAEQLPGEVMQQIKKLLA